MKGCYDSMSLNQIKSLNRPPIFFEPLYGVRGSGEPAERRLKSLLLLGSVFRHREAPQPGVSRTPLGGDLHLIKKFVKRKPTVPSLFDVKEGRMVQWLAPLDCQIYDRGSTPRAVSYTHLTLPTKA